MHPRVIRGCISTCASGVVVLRLRRSSSRRRLYHSRVSRASVSLARASRAVDLPSRCSLPRRRCLRFASLAFPSRHVPQAPSVFACVARRRGGVQITRASLALACRRCAPPAPSTFHSPRASPRWRCLISCLSRFHLGTRLRHRRSLRRSSSRRCPISLARLSRSRVVGARLPRRRPPLALLVATIALLASRGSRVFISACALGAVGPRLRCSSSRRRPISLARLSRSRIVGARLQRRRPSLALLVATMALPASRGSRVSISACALGAVGPRLRRSSPRRNPILLACLSRSCVVGARLPRRRPSFASLVVTTALLAFRVFHVFFLAWASDADGLCWRRSLPRKRPKLLPCLSRPRVVGARLSRRRPSFASLVATTALPHFVSLAFSSRGVPQAPSVFASLVVMTVSQITRVSLASLVIATAYTSLAHHERSRVCGERLPRRRPSFASLVATAALLAFCVFCTSNSCASGAVGLRLRPSSSRRCPTSLPRLLCSHVVGVRLPRRRPSFASLIATTALLVFRVFRIVISACASGAVGLRLHRSSSRRRPASLARLLRSHVAGARLPRRRPSFASLGATTALLAFRVSRAPISGAVILRSHRSSSRRRKHRSRSPRARVSSARASCAVDLPSLRSSPRRRCWRSASPAFRLGPRRSSFASLVITTALQVARHLSRSRVVGVRLSRRRPFHASHVAAMALLAFRVSRVPTSTCASGAVGLRLRRSLSRRRPKSLARLSRSRVVGVRLPRRLPTLASLAATTALFAVRVSRVSISRAPSAVILRSH